MKIQLASDLHLEFLQSKWDEERLISPHPDADVLVLAGDIASDTDVHYHFADWPVPVIYVLGNHELYGQEYGDVYANVAKITRDSVIHFLEKQTVEIGGIRFLGCTLWTDYLLKGSNQPQHVLMSVADRSLNDHRLIRKGEVPFSPKMALVEHQRSVDWLRWELEKPFAGKTVVVTHHGPHPNSVHPRYQSDELSAAFVSDLSDLLPYADLWMHGHVHDSFDYQVGRCRVVANPAGYVLNRRAAAGREDFIFENGKKQRAEQVIPMYGRICQKCIRERGGKSDKGYFSVRRDSCNYCAEESDAFNADDFVFTKPVEGARWWDPNLLIEI